MEQKTHKHRLTRRVFPCLFWGWSGGAKVLGKLSVLGRPTIWITVGQGPTALAVGAGWGCLDIFTLLYPFSPLSPSLWETARYRLKYCLKGLLNLKQPTNLACFILKYKYRITARYSNLDDKHAFASLAMFDIQYPIKEWLDKRATLYPRIKHVLKEDM